MTGHTLRGDHIERPSPGYWPQDSRGYLINPCRLPITEPWDALVSATVTVVRRSTQIPLHSIYVRGTVAQGTARIGTADLDLVIVTTSPTSHAGTKQWTGEINRRVLPYYPFCSKIDVSFASLTGLMTSPAARTLKLLLKIGSVIVHGDDIRESIEEYQPTPALGFSASELPWIVRDFPTRFGASRPLDRQRLVSKVMRIAVRAAGEVTLLPMGRYTRDLELCATHFAEDFPKAAELIREAMSGGLRPYDCRRPVRLLTQIGAAIAPGANRLAGVLPSR